jgi:iron(III) transport system substrate-binding protein
MRRGAWRLVAVLAAVALAALVVAGCSDDGSDVRSSGSGSGSEAASGSNSGPSSQDFAPTGKGAGSITVYSGQHPETVSRLVRDFREATGIGVSLRSGGEGELANQIIQEGGNSPADVFYAANSPSLVALDERGLLAPTAPATLAAVPRSDSAPTGHWVGVSARSAVLVYDPAKVSPDQLPKSLLDLAKPEWKGRIGFSATETDFQPLVSAVIAEDGHDAAKSWLEGLKRNGTTYDGNVPIIDDVNRGELAAGIVEHYYWYRLRDEIGASALKARLYYFPAGDPGALVAVSGAGVLASSSHTQAAQAFLRYLVSRRGQEVIAHSDSYEYPLRPGVRNPSLQRSFDELKPPSVGIEQLGDGRQAFELLQEVGLL